MFFFFLFILTQLRTGHANPNLTTAPSDHPQHCTRMSEAPKPAADHPIAVEGPLQTKYGNIDRSRFYDYGSFPNAGKFTTAYNVGLMENCAFKVKTRGRSSTHAHTLPCSSDCTRTASPRTHVVLSHALSGRICALAPHHCENPYASISPLFFLSVCDIGNSGRRDGPSLRRVYGFNGYLT